MEKKGLKHPKIFLISTVPFSRDKNYACESCLYILFFSGGTAPSYVYRLLSEFYHPDDHDL